MGMHGQHNRQQTVIFGAGLRYQAPGDLALEHQNCFPYIVDLLQQPEYQRRRNIVGQIPDNHQLFCIFLLRDAPQVQLQNIGFNQTKPGTRETPPQEFRQIAIDFHRHQPSETSS